MRRWAGPVSAAIVMIAAPARGENDEVVRHVEAVVSADPAGAEETEAVVRELLGRVDVTLAVRRVDRIDAAEVLSPDPNATPAAARVWIDLRNPDRANMFIADGAWSRILIRRVDRTESSDEVVREIFGHVILESVDALLAKNLIGVPIAEARQSLGLAEPDPDPPATDPPPAPPAPPSAPPASAATPIADRPPERAEPRTFGFDVAALYEASIFSDEETLSHGPAGFLSAAVPVAPFAPELRALVGFRLPTTVPGEIASARFSTVVLRVGPMLRAVETPAVRFGFGALFGGDFVLLEPRLREGADADASSNRTVAVPVARPSLDLRVRISRSLGFVATLGVDVDLRTTRYVVETADATTETVLEPWPARPLLTLGLVGHVFGAEVFPNR